MRLELLIDLDDLLRDGGVLRIGEWDANGSFFLLILLCFKKDALLFKGLTARDMSSRLTSHFMPITITVAGHDRLGRAGIIRRGVWRVLHKITLVGTPCGHPPWP
jgi:hypothetical protein